MRNEIRSVNPEAPIRFAGPLPEAIARSLSKRRFALYLLGVFAALAAALTAVGVYGVIAYSLSRRTREFAIRFALGAGRFEVWSAILAGFALPALAGLAAGSWLASSFAQILKTQLYRLPSADPLALAASAAAILALIVLAAALPAKKASALPPAMLLRE